MKRKNIGSSMDSFFDEEGSLDEVIHMTRKKVISDEIRHQMGRRKISLSNLAKRMCTSRAVVYRLLDASEGVTLDILERASKALEMDLVVKLVARRPKQLATRQTRARKAAA